MIRVNDNNIGYKKGPDLTAPTFTLSVGTSAAPAAPYNTLTGNHLIANGHEDAYCQGGWHYDTSFVSLTQRQFPCINRTSGGNITSTTSGNFWKVSFVVDGPFAFRVDGDDTTLSFYKVVIHGREYSLTNPTAVSGGRRWMTIDPGPGVSHIIVKSITSLRWSGYLTNPGGLAAPWQPNRTSFIFGDSFSYGTGASFNSSGFAALWALSSNHNISANAIGGGGYVAAGDYQALPNRIASEYNALAADNGTPDEVIIAVGLNDLGLSGIESAANTTYDNLRTVYSGPVYVLSPFDLNAPSTPSANFTSAKTAIQNALTGRSNFYFIDFEGVAYTKADGTHPDDSGHLTLANYLGNYFLNNN